MKTFSLAVLLLGLALAGALAWGWRQASTHADVSLYIHDAAPSTGPKTYAHLVFVELELTDAEGLVLARAVPAGLYGYPSFVHPVFGDCSRFEQDLGKGIDAKKAWDECHGALTLWSSTWAHKVRLVNIRLPHCRIDKLQTAVQLYRDSWWTWWIPLPHAGGQAVTLYSVRVALNSASCQSARLGG